MRLCLTGHQEPGCVETWGFRQQMNILTCSGRVFSGLTKREQINRKHNATKIGYHVSIIWIILHIRIAFAHPFARASWLRNSTFWSNATIWLWNEMVSWKGPDLFCFFFPFCFFCWSPVLRFPCYVQHFGTGSCHISTVFCNVSEFEPVIFLSICNIVVLELLMSHGFWQLGFT